MFGWLLRFVRDKDHKTIPASWVPPTAPKVPGQASEPPITAAWAPARVAPVVKAAPPSSPRSPAPPRSPARPSTSTSFSRVADDDAVLNTMLSSAIYSAAASSPAPSHSACSASSSSPPPYSPSSYDSGVSYSDSGVSLGGCD